VAPSIFLVVRAVNRLREKEVEMPAAPPAPTAEEKLLVEIRDLLKAGR
jgi:large conductance mechanosensitive channel